MLARAYHVVEILGTTQVIPTLDKFEHTPSPYCNCQPTRSDGHTYVHACFEEDTDDA